jgi:hypothetical protein
MHQGFSEYYRKRASVEYTSGSKFIAFVCTHRSQVREREREVDCLGRSHVYLEQLCLAATAPCHSCAL